MSTATKSAVPATGSGWTKQTKVLCAVVGIVTLGAIVGGIVAAVELTGGSSDSGTGSSSDDSVNTGNSTTGSNSTTTTSSIYCLNTAAASVISISEGTDGYRTVNANGCPAYDTSGETTPNTATIMSYVVKFPTSPKLAASKTYIGVYRDKAQTVTNPNVPLGPVGLAINGVVFYGNGDADKEDAYVSESATFDSCQGHSDATGAYHYHAEAGAGCAYTDVSGQHSPLYGLMIDGIPIFGAYGDGGAVPTDLDECNGHVDSTYPFYHYHVQDNYEYPYLVNCLAGCVNYVSSTDDFVPRISSSTTCTLASTQYNYTTLPALIQASL